MSFSHKGVSLGIAFVDINKSSDGVFTSEKYSSNWDGGFYPAITLGAHEIVTINLGQEPLESLPPGFISVYNLPATHQAKDDVLPLLFKRYCSDQNTFIPYTCSESVFTLDALLGVYCTLQSSMRIFLQIPYTASDGPKTALKISSSKPLKAYQWTHCSIQIQESNLSTVKNYIRIYLNGTLDVDTDVVGKIELRTKDPLSFGCLAHERRKVSISPSCVWIENIEISSRDKHHNNINERPIHKSTMRILGKSLMALKPEGIATLLVSSDINETLMMLDVLLSTYNGLQGDSQQHIRGDSDLFLELIPKPHLICC